MKTRDNIAGWASCVAGPANAICVVPFASWTTTPRPNSSHSCCARKTIRARMVGTTKFGATDGPGVSGGGPGGRGVVQPAASSAAPRRMGASCMRAPGSEAAHFRLRSTGGSARPRTKVAALEQPRRGEAEDEPPERRADVEDRRVGDRDEERHERAERE